MGRTLRTRTGLSAFGGLLLGVLLTTLAPDAQNSIPPIVIEGLDPVLLVQGEERQGKLELPADHGGFRYLFASSESRDRFLEDPARYAVQLGGVCARMGPGNPFCVHGPYGPGIAHPDIWAVVRERVYLFWTVDCRNVFAAAPDAFLEPEPPLLTPSEADLRRGRSLVERAVDAAGGMARLSALTTYTSTSSVVMRSPFGEQAGTRTIRWVLPDQARIDMQGGPLTFQAVVTPDRGLVVSALKGMGRFETALQPAQRDRHLRRVRYHLDPLGILAASSHPDFMAFALEAEGPQKSDLVRVAVRFGAVAVTVGIDTDDGRIRTLRFVDRHADGESGERLLTFDDYRMVDGLAIPHAVTGRFNGQPDPEWTWTVTSVSLNQPIDASLFDGPN